MSLKAIGFWKKRRVVYASILITFIGTLHLLIKSRDGSFRSYYPSALTGAHHSGYEQFDPSDHCSGLQGLDDIFIIVRTGFNEVQNKLPSLLDTSLPCFRHYGIWSDLEEEYGGYRIRDALEGSINSSLVGDRPELQYYQKLKEKGRDAFTAEEIEKWADAPNSNLGRDTPAWKLDKWKFLPLADKAFHEAPDSKWYMFMECDTYVFWSSLLSYLGRIDATKPYYLGRQMWSAGEVFAYGGAGILLSNPAMRRLVARHENDTAAYDDFTARNWAGDFVLAHALQDAGIKLSEIWPTLEGGAPAEIDLGAKSTQGNHLWCYYAATYHHMNPEDIYAFYEFDLAWKAEHKDPPRNGDIFRHMLHPRMLPHKPDWDNLSADEAQGEDNSTWEACQALCEKKDDCMQFSLVKHVCKTSNKVKLGHQVALSEEAESGWIMSRIDKYINDMDATCGATSWVLPSN